MEPGLAVIWEMNHTQYQAGGQNDGNVSPSFDAHAVLAGALDRQQIGMCLYDADDRVVCWNATYLDIFPEEADILAPGLPYAETLRRFYEINLPLEELPFLERHLSSGLKRHYEKRDPFVYQRKDGRWISNEPYWLDDGGLLVMWRDITETDVHGSSGWPELKDALADISIAFVLFDAEYGFVSANKAYAELFPHGVDLNLSGTSYHEHMQRHAEKALDARERRRIDALLVRKMSAPAEPVKNPMVFRHSGGGWLQLEERPTKSGGLICIWSDVSERVEAQAQIATLQERLSDAIESLVDGFALFDSDDRLIICNSRYRELNPLVSDLIKPGIRWEDMVRTAAARGQYPEATGAVDAWLEQRRIHRQCADGAPFEQQLNDGIWVRATDLRTHDGGMVGIRSDITDLKHSEQQFRTIAESIAVIINDVDGRVLYASPPAAELFRTPIEQLLQQYAGDFFADSDEHKVLAGELVKTGRLENVEFLGRRGDATTFPAAGTAKRIIYNGKPCYINTLLDLSERKLAEELSRAKQAAEEANRMKSQFLAHMSHELRTPLNAVLGYSQILRRDGELSEKQRDGLNVIHTAGEHLLALINDLLDFPRSEARRLEVNNGVFNLKHFLQGVERIFRFKAEEKQLSFRQNLAADLPAMVSGDARKLRQIIFNLLGNAIKFTATGHIEFAVGQDSTDGQIRFSVTDTGAGIRQHDLERVFQPFQQAGEKETMPEGTGLGLTISRNMVELLGGKLHLESEYGRGSRFWFSIPLPASDAAPAEPAESGEEPTAPAAANDNMLIFPDEEELTLLRELARQGDIKTILERVRRLQQQDARYSPFAGELKALAKGFQIKKIAQFLTRR